MSTVLVYTSPARGHLYPVMDIAVALRAGGHRVVAHTLAAEKASVEQAGVEHRPLDPRIEALPLEDFQRGNPLSQLRHTLQRWMERAPLEVSDLRASMDEIDPDLLLVDANSWGAAAVAQASGRPWAMFLPYCLTVPSVDAPAFGPGFAPPRGWLGRARDRWVWRLLRWVGRGPFRQLSALRQDLGLGPCAGTPELFATAPLVLLRTSEPFEYPRSDWPANVRAIGPGLWCPPGEAPAWLAELPRPRVLVTVSTELQEDGAIIDAALEALADQPGSIIVTTGALDPSRFRAPHERVRIERFLDHAAVVPQVDLVISHGGMGSTQRALAAGVPVVVVPWGRDQLETGRRVQACGAGNMVPRGRLKASRLAGAVQEALALQAGAHRVAEGFAAAGGAAEAVRLLGLSDED